MKHLWSSRWLKGLMALALAIVLCLAPGGEAWARSGGRVGGGSFRAPRPSRSMPSRRPTSGPIFPGGGWGFPFFFPFFFGGGGGGLLTVLLVLGVGSFLVRNFQATGSEDHGGYDEKGFYKPANQKVQLTEVKLGLLATARDLQKEIDRLALESDTETPEGLRELLQNVTVSLNRYSDYWVYAQTNQSKVALADAEQAFYQKSLQERSKFSAETLSNIDQRIQSKQSGTSSTDVGEYIVVTLLVASYSDSSTLPVADSAAVLRQGMMKLGAMPANNIVAVEVLWTPQQEGDTLTADELLVEYPQLKRL